MSSSMLLTFGPLLDRAQEQSAPVSILIGDQWIVGDVAARDGVGVLIITDKGEMALLRLEAISAVKSKAKGLTALHVPEPRAV